MIFSLVLVVLGSVNSLSHFEMFTLLCSVMDEPAHITDSSTTKQTKGVRQTGPACPPLKLPI